MSDIGGIMAAGATAAGFRSSLGTVRDLSAAAGPLGSVSVSFAFDSLVPDAARFLGLIDGVPSLRLALGEPWEVEPLGVGTFDLTVYPIDATDQTDPFLAPDLIGNKVFLQWEPPTETATLAGYRVYNAILQRLASITVLEVGGVSAVSVVGTGAPVVTGGWLLAQVEQALRVEVDGGNWTLRAGSTVLASGPVEVGVEQSTATGLSIEWTPGSYLDGDEWEIALQFPRYAVVPGSGTFKVVAVDTSGIETPLASAPSATVNPIGLPDPPVVTGYTFNSSTRVARLDFTRPTGCSVNVYTDIDTAAAGLAPFIEEAWPIASTGDFHVTFTVPASMSSFRAYVRSLKTSTGREEDNATVYAFAALATGVTPTGQAVTIVSITPATDYHAVVLWSLDIENATPTEVQVWASASETGSQTLIDTLAVTLTLEDFPTLTRSSLIDLGGPGDVWLELRAIYADGSAVGIVTGPVVPVASGVSDVPTLSGWEN